MRPERCRLPDLSRRRTWFSKRGGASATTNQYTAHSPAYIRRRAILWRIRDEYDAAKLEREEILESSPPPPDGMPGGRKITNPVQDKAVRLAAIDRFISAVESGLAVVPPEFRDAVWAHVRYGGRWPIDAARSTYERWERRYLTAVAVRMEG